MVEGDGASEAVAVTSETLILDEASLAKMSRLASAFEPARQGERGRGIAMTLVESRTHASRTSSRPGSGV